MANVNVVFLMGQSNCWGQGSTQTHVVRPPYALPIPNAFIWDKITTATPHTINGGGAWVALDRGFGFQGSGGTAPSGTNADAIGCELQLAYRIRQAFPNEDVYISKCARGGAPLAATGAKIDWSPSTSELYDVWLQDYFTVPIDAIYTAGDTPKFFGAAWVQGAADADSQADADAYEANLTTLLAQIRADVGGIGTKHIAIMRESNYRLTQHPFIKTVRDAQTAVAAADANATLFTTDTTRTAVPLYNEDGVIPNSLSHYVETFPKIAVTEGGVIDHEHFTGQGQFDLGNAIADALIPAAQASAPITIPDPVP